MAATKYAPSKFLQRKQKELAKIKAGAGKAVVYPGTKVPKHKAADSGNIGTGGHELQQLATGV